MSADPSPARTLHDCRAAKAGIDTALNGISRNLQSARLRPECDVDPTLEGGMLDRTFQAYFASKHLPRLKTSSSASRFCAASLHARCCSYFLRHLTVAEALRGGAVP
jgi:hypothetical protein